MPAKTKKPSAKKKEAPVVPVTVVSKPSVQSIPVESEAPSATAVAVQAEPSLEEALESAPEDTTKIRSDVLLYRLGILVTIGIILITAAVALVALGARRGDEGKEIAVTAPAPAPQPAVSKAAITFEVRNATGVSGSAAKAGSALTRAGYTVIALGNAAKQKGSELFLSASLAPAAVTEILKDTESLFSVASSSGDRAGQKDGTDSTASAVLILGN
jgi:hypothetical protein